MRTVEDICKECGKKLSDVKAVEYDDSGMMIKRVEFYTPGDQMPSLGGGLPWPVPQPSYTPPPQPSHPTWPVSPSIPPYQPVWMDPTKGPSPDYLRGG
jgi:hypothetical protein